MNDFEINDKRLNKDFSNITFSGFKKTQVKKKFIESLNKGDIEQSNYWCAEFICSGHFLEIWEYIIEYFSKNIHTGNIKFPFYLDNSINKFINILKSKYVDNEINLRNNNEIRKLFSEIICIICQSNKKPKLEKQKISKDDFNMMNISHRLKATDSNFSKNVIKNFDPKEINICINEFCYAIDNQVKLYGHACFWIDWIIEYEKLIKSKKNKLICCKRSLAPVDDKFQSDIVWIIWESLFNESNKRTEFIKKIINCLFNIFCVRFTPNTKKKRRYIIYFAIYLLTEPINTQIPLASNLEQISNVKNNINVIYKQIKKKEQQPENSYLFHGLKNNKDEKVDILTNINFIPRH